MAGCDFFSISRTDQRNEGIDLPSGDQILNDTYIEYGVRVNQYYVIFDGAKEKEYLGKLTSKHFSAGLLSTNMNIQLIRNGDKALCSIGNQIFKRWERNAKPWWYQWSIDNDAETRFFLRSFQDTYSNPPDEGSNAEWFYYRLPAPPEYRFDSVDMDRNSLTLKATKDVHPWPQVLAYKAERYGFCWQFDLARTLEIDPSLIYKHFPTNIVAHIMFITVPGDLSQIRGDQPDELLKLKGAQLISDKEIEISDTHRVLVTAEHHLPSGDTRNDSFDIIGAYGDPNPELLSIYWRRHPILWQDWHLMKIGEWEQVDASGFKGDICQFVFLKLKIF